MPNLLKPPPEFIPQHFKSKPSFLKKNCLENSVFGHHHDKSNAMKNKIMSTYLERYADVIACLNEKGNSKVSSTTDLWTSGNNFAMIAVTGFREIPGQHSGVNIVASFYGVLTEYQIADKIRNLSKACQSYPQRLAQFKEGLQAANVAFETFGDPFEIKSHAVAEKKQVQENTQSSRSLLIDLLRDVPTRWNATYYMNERSLSIRKGVEEVTARNRDLRD
ncbi:hypothetical protein DAPPUDRAFT_116130 [Daphnia pulex]|uniref:Uncharacterized protein n=1 Tax=Daphnia pulex TaxID=6669 RepID=E9HNN1_DAPPU|nr:hypothetical protein DAPPUDRAFT_116130 [Daphnia pulex]|eukprot:EFX66633.1 hypothetical protein DAPPUDRAFT_116130 [Daphnia pulex]